MTRKRLLAAVSKALGRRSLIWAGIRGDDVEPLRDLPQLSGSFAIIGAYRNRSGIDSMAYEDLSGRRVDLEKWDIDDHLADAEAVEFRRALLSALSGPSALLPYRPSRFLSAVAFARDDRCINLGLSGGQQFAFEHKPWVESALGGLGLPRVPWRYIADSEQARTIGLFEDGPVVLRRSRTSGGVGFRVVDSFEELAEQWFSGAEGFVSVAPFLDETVPVNVGAVVWDSGVTIHYPSVQLVGISALVSRRFGYCGNDFGAMRDVDAEVVDQIESAVMSIGMWLNRHGYRGSCGVDFLVHRGQALFSEINPRFQGSTHASCQLSVETGESCLMLEHIAALLGMEAPVANMRLRDRVASTPDFAHLVLHSTRDEPTNVNGSILAESFSRLDGWCRTDVLADSRIQIDPGAVLARSVFRRRITESGFELKEPWRTTIEGWRELGKV